MKKIIIVLLFFTILVHRKYGESYVEYGFSSINFNEDEKPQCVIYSKVLFIE